MTDPLERLAALGIERVAMPGLERYWVFARGVCACLVEKTELGFGRIGTAGQMTAHGLAMLVWRDGQPFLVARNHEQPASEEEVIALRQFSSELEQVLRDLG